MQTFKFFGTAYEMQATTGQVLSAKRSLETQIQGRGGAVNYNSGYATPISITSKTVKHDELFIADRNGRELDFYFTNFDFSCRESNMITLVSAIKVKAGEGPFVALINHTTGKVYFNNRNITDLAVPSYKKLLVGFGIITILALNFIGIASVGFLAVLLVAGLIFYFFHLNDHASKIKNSITPTNYPLNWPA